MALLNEIRVLYARACEEADRAAGPTGQPWS